MKQRTRTVTVIGWMWLAWAVLNLTKSLNNFANLEVTFTKFQALAVNPPQGFKNTLELMVPIVSYYPAVVLVHFLFFIMCAVSGIFFLRRKRWAFRSVQTLNLASILMLVALAWFGVRFQTALTADGMSLRHGYWGLLAIVGLACVFVFLAFCLRTKKVANAFVREPHAIHV